MITHLQVWAFKLVFTLEYVSTVYYLQPQRLSWYKSDERYPGITIL